MARQISSIVFASRKVRRSLPSNGTGDDRLQRRGHFRREPPHRHAAAALPVAEGEIRHGKPAIRAEQAGRGVGADERRDRSPTRRGEQARALVPVLRRGAELESGPLEQHGLVPRRRALDRMAGEAELEEAHLVVDELIVEVAAEAEIGDHQAEIGGEEPDLLAARQRHVFRRRHQPHACGRHVARRFRQQRAAAIAAIAPGIARDAREGLLRRGVPPLVRHCLGLRPNRSADSIYLV
ncbi:MAG: hypothetical protein WDN24_06415 [Sphingomonas sp.]